MKYLWIKKNGQVILNHDNRWFNFLKKCLEPHGSNNTFWRKKIYFFYFSKKGTFLIKSDNFQTNLIHLPHHLAMNLISVLTIIKHLKLD